VDRDAGRIAREQTSVALLADRGEQVVEVEWRRPAAVSVRARDVGPPLAWEVRGELDPVAVRIREVDRLVGPVIGGALDGRPRRRDPKGCAGRLLARGEQEREVVQARVSAGRGCVLRLDRGS
jgi:hypothetical protein